MLGNDRDLRIKLGMNGRERIIKCFNHEETIGAYEKIYQQVCRNRFHVGRNKVPMAYEFSYRCNKLIEAWMPRNGLKCSVMDRWI